MKRWLKPLIIVLVAVAIALVASAWLFPERLAAFGIHLELPQIETVDQGVQSKPLGHDEMVGIIMKHLKVPTDLAFLPEGGMLVTERDGRLHVMHDIGSASATDTVIPVEGVHADGDGGLLSVAVHPAFNTTKWIYLYMTVEREGAVTNRVDRYQFEDNTLGERTTIIQGIPGGFANNGGHLVFGPDAKLYIGTGVGDSNNGDAQAISSLAGKILRLTDTGATPNDNPSQGPVWASGFHNVLGMTWDAEGKMWATDTGHKGIQTGYDEVNMVEAGKNYGWPNNVGDEADPGQEKPYVHSGPLESWTPSGITWLRPAMLFTGLRGEALYELNLIDNPDHKVIGHFQHQFGRMRAVKVGPDHSIYVITSNDDGLGTPNPDGDMILSVNPRILGR